MVSFEVEAADIVVELVEPLEAEEVEHTAVGEEEVVDIVVELVEPLKAEEVEMHSDLIAVDQ